MRARRSGTWRLSIAVVAFVVVLGAVIASVRSGRRADDLVVHTLQVKMALGAYLGEVVDAETGQRGYILTADPKYLEPYRLARVGPHEQAVRELLRDNPRQLARLDEAAAHARARIAELRTVLDIHASDPAAATVHILQGQGEAAMSSFRGTIAAMQEEEATLFEQRHAAMRRSFLRTLLVLVGASVLFGLALLRLVQTRSDLDRARDSAEAALERARSVEFSDRFLAVLGHDLRNPLTAIRISIDRLEKKLGADAEPHLGRVRRNLERMERMIDQLLDLTRIRLGSGIALAKRYVDVADVVREVVEQLRAASPKKTVELVVSGDTTGDFDPRRLTQIVQNLLGNAVTHGTAGHPVRVALDGRDHELVLRVENVGEMSAEERFVLFHPFRRGLREPSKTSKSAGLGLGLSIVRHLVEQHHGHISIESDATTIFTVTLPR